MQTIELVGHFDAELGVGEAARRLANLVEAAGFNVVRTNLETTSSRRHHITLSPAQKRQFKVDIQIFCTNPDQLGWALAGNMYSRNSAVRRIGFWSWELEAFPKIFHPAYDFVDEVWTVSDFCKIAIKACTSKAVKKLSLPAISSGLGNGFDRSSLGLTKNDFVILCSFDFFSGFQRKNPEAAIKAFMSAFPEEVSARLIVKSINGNHFPKELEILRGLADGRSDIIFIDSYFSAVQNLALLADADLLLSLHRSEGFGLNIFDAMTFGTQVIATGYSGNQDFMKNSAAISVPFDLIRVTNYAGVKLNSFWAEPSIEIAAEEIQKLYRNRSSLKETSLLLKKHITDNFSLKVLANTFSKDAQLA